MPFLDGWDTDNILQLFIDSSKVDSDLTDFPVLITLSSGIGINSFDATAVFDELGDANQKRIAITTNDGTTQCPVEIEYWDATEEEAFLWTKIPTILSVSDTIFYLYYDSTQPDNTTYVGDTGDTPAQDVWNDNFVAVYHMAQDPSTGGACILDSTSNTEHGTTIGSMLTEDLVGGKVGKAIDFDGNDDYIDIPLSMDIGSPSLEATFEFITKGSNHVIGTERSSSNTGDAQVYTSGNGKVTYYIDNQDGPPYSETIVSTATATITEFNYYAVSTNITSNNYLLTVNSVTEQIYKSFLTGTQAYTDVTIGRHRNYIWGTTYFTGVLDEIRVSNIARSSAWLKATYYSNWDDFITYVDYLYIPPSPPPATISGVANIWAVNTFVFKTMASGIGVYDATSEALLGLISYPPSQAGAVWANDDYLYIATLNSGVISSPMSSISGAIYNDLSTYKAYPDISNNYVNYVHGIDSYLCVATISGAHIFDLITNSGIYVNTSIAADKCHQLADRTSYYIYDDKLETVYNDNTTYIYQAGDGIIPTVSGMNDLYVVSGTKNLILLGTTYGAVVIEENKGSEPLSRFKYYYIEE